MIHGFSASKSASRPLHSNATAASDMAEKCDDSEFSNELRVRTKVAHDESDRLINLKLAAVLTDTKLWATAVGEFYFVFREIERNLESLQEDSKIGRLLSAVSDGLRTQAFEQDLEFYLGSDWRTIVKPSTVVVEYCDRIAKVASENPVLLIAYVHSMYLALLAGGQIIRTIVRKTLGLSGDAGLELFNFSKVDRTDLRKRIKVTIDHLELTGEEKEAIIQEKIRIFKMNNLIASNIKTTWSSYYRLAVLVAFVVFCILVCIFAWSLLQ